MSDKENGFENVIKLKILKHLEIDFIENRIDNEILDIINELNENIKHLKNYHVSVDTYLECDECVLIWFHDYNFGILIENKMKTLDLLDIIYRKL
jgi:hypothetical protein